MFDPRPLRWLPVAILLSAPAAQAQSATTDYRDEFLGHFGRSSHKISALAEAMPEELYGWSPMEGAMSVQHVYMHLARYNFYYLESSLGIPAPEGIDVENLEEVTGKDLVMSLFQRSVEHVKAAISEMTAEELAAPTILYGRNVAGWAVLFQLLSHMNEHVGQSVAYARMNDVVPPWSM